MNTTIRLHIKLGAIAAPFLLAGALHGAEPAGAAATPPPASADTIGDAFTKGKFSINVRARYEYVDQGNLTNTSNAFTIRSRFGFTTAPISGFKAMIEAENTTAIDGDAYNQAGLNPGGAGQPVVADPEGSEINQVWLGYTSGKTDLKLGRQRLVLDNARFVGDVGWRQNMQTFDAVTIQDKTVDKLTLTYGYLSQINRVFGKDHAQGTWESDSHLVNASYAGLPVGTLTGYAYLLDFDNAAANSSATYGLSLAGSRKVSEELTIGYRAEYAAQSDYGSSTLDYSTDYLVGELTLGNKSVTGGLGYEVLGTDNNVGFKTPLATLHAFNGWADVFLATPAGGLRDLYGKVSFKLPGGINVLGFYHTFETDTGDDLGDEIDLQAAYKINKYFTALVKVATFSSDSTLPDVDKIWAQFEFTF